MNVTNIQRLASGRLVLVSLLLVGLGSLGLGNDSRSGKEQISPQVSKHDFHFRTLARSWDEGVPLGNGMLGALVWQKDSALRIALDRADLWDLRKVKEFERPEFRFSWVIDQVNKGDYKPVQALSDLPYERDAAPTKLPGAALEFEIPDVSAVEEVHLSLGQALCTVTWRSGIRLRTFVHATEPRGWFMIDGSATKIRPRIAAPPYGLSDSSGRSPGGGPGGNDLRRLDYPAPRIIEGEREITYHQECSEGFFYDVWVGWTYGPNNELVGCWTISPNRPYGLSRLVPTLGLRGVMQRAFDRDLRSHRAWWSNFWSRSSIWLPDSILETQWYREMYKFGSASRPGAPPITLQAVWTADNGRLPPWKGDFHHDLNTQLSYWPAYSSNHLDEESAFLDWLWACKPVAERYTETFFGKEGLNFAGVSTLTGDPMGGWIQYSLSPTISAWLAQHFYLHWQYSMDRKFLEQSAYPWLRAVAVFLDEVSIRDKTGHRRLPLSSSPEINDNRIDAWFRTTTNYDLALIRWLYGAAEELAGELGKEEEAKRWGMICSEWPEFALDSVTKKLLVAPGIPLKESHRHFSHLMAIHPLGLIDWDGGEADKQIIFSSLSDLERLGTDWWCGYSYAWLGNLWARARNGGKAAEALRTFATCFCLPNSFHVNGDQSGTGKSKFIYRPFTLEGNFACAEGIQQMLLQSQGRIVRVFPAVPEAWKDVSFTDLRAEGALLISAERHDGKTGFVRIRSEKGGRVRVQNPFDGREFVTESDRPVKIRLEGQMIEFDARPTTTVTLRPKNR